MATNVFIHGVGQVESNYLSDIQLLSSSDLVSTIDANYPTEGVFYQVKTDALNQYYARHFVGLTPTDFDSTNYGIGPTDVQDHLPILFLKDLVTDVTDGVATTFVVVESDEYTTYGNDTKTVNIKGKTAVEDFTTALRNDIVRIFGSAFDVSSLDVTGSSGTQSVVSHNSFATAIKDFIEGQDTSNVIAAIVSDFLRIENVEELQQLIDSSDNSGYNFDSFADDANAGNRTASALFLQGDIFKFRNGIKFEFSFKVPDYNPKEIYTSANAAMPALAAMTNDGLSTSRWTIEEITEFGSYTEFKLTMYQDLYVVVQDS